MAVYCIKLNGGGSKFKERYKNINQKMGAKYFFIWHKPQLESSLFWGGSGECLAGEAGKLKIV